MLSSPRPCTSTIVQSGPPGGWVRLALAALLLAALAAGSAARAGDLDRVSSFNIPAQRLDKALLQFGTLARVQILFTAGAPAMRRTTRPLMGLYTERSALAALLRGTGLKYVLHGSTIQILGNETRDPPRWGQGTAIDPAEPAQKTESEKAAPVVMQSDARKATRSSRATVLQEIIVTGTHIAGVTAIAPPASSYSQGDIYATGAGSIGEFISRLPANFSEVSEMNPAVTPSGPGESISNGVGAVGFDIHGLGVQSTLVLINGHRMSEGNDSGNFADVSLIPLSAIQRIDVLKDSASAIYGSDAVGGVVNVITNTHFDGAETRLRYGEVTRGGRTETTASETAGTSWSRGAAVLGYEYGDETPLAASSRSFSEQAPGSLSLLPEQTRHSLYGSVTESLPADLLLSGLVLYGHRTLQDSYLVARGNFVRDSDTVDSLTAEVGIEKNFASGNVARGSVEYSGNDSHHIAFLGSQSTPGEYIPAADDEGKSQLTAVDLDYSGSFAVLRGRTVHYALGGQERKERLSYRDYLPISLYQPDRTVLSGYVELHIPIVRTVAFTAAYRHEHYSDFGATDNPKIGLEWSPVSSVGVSATYSEAFRAPALMDMNPVPSEAVYIALPDPLKGGIRNTCGFLPPPQVGCTPVLLLYGGNPNLKPETAKSWTTTVAVHPRSVRGLKLSLSFYDVKYYNRINLLSEAYGNPLNVLEDESKFGGGIVQRGLPQQEIQQLAQSASPNLFNFTGVDPAQVTTLVDDRSLNLSRLSTRGIDFDLSYSNELGAANVVSELEGTRILQYRSQFSPLSAPINALNTAYHPIKLKMRLREGVTLGRARANVFINYTGAYTDNLSQPVVPIASWTTIDASVAYRVFQSSQTARSAEISIGCLNLADRNPPFVSNPSFLLNFDGANATPLGRFVYAEARLAL